MGSTQTDSSNQDNDLLSGHSLIYMFGFGCSIFIVGTLIAAPRLQLLSFLSFQDASMLRAICIGTMVVSFLFVATRADFVIADFHALAIPCAIFLICPMVYAAVCLAVGTASLAIGIVCWVVFGIGVSFLMPTWMYLLNSHDMASRTYLIPLGSVIGTVLFLITYLIGIAYVSITLAAAFVLCGILISTRLLKDTETTTVADSPADPRIAAADFPAVSKATVTAGPAMDSADDGSKDLPHRKQIIFECITIIAEGIAFGYVASIACSLGAISALLTGASGIIGDLLALLWVMLRRHFTVNTDTVNRVSFVIIITGLVLLPFYGLVGQTVCACLVVAGISHNMMAVFTRSDISVDKPSTNPLRYIALHQATDWLGFLIGLILWLCIVRIAGGTVQSLFAATAALVIVLSATHSLFNEEKEHSHRQLLDIMASVEAPQQVIDDNTMIEFKDACDKICAEYRLSKRESEVFTYLARGWSTKYIQDALFIGESTVKTHTYNIYQKMGIHSQQELMMIVDENSENTAGVI